jgi:glycosyltransferase involved in cell wall biosynthesis
VCWQGSMTHYKDLKIAIEGFKKLAKDDSISFKLWCGIDRRTKNPVFDVKDAEIVQLVPFEAFFQMFGQIQPYIGLAPVAANSFNKGKSNLKFLEYTVYDAVTVASDFGPYKDTIEDGVTGILVSDNRTWYERVKELLENKDLYQTILNNAKELVRDKYNIEKNYIYWQNALMEVYETHGK